MKRLCLISAMAFLFFNCSKKDSEDVSAIVESIYPIQTFIGDTLTLTGQNLSRLSKITMSNEDVDLSTQVNSFIFRTDTEIKFIVPELYHENVTVYTTSDNPGIEIELFGFIPYSYRNNGSIYRNAELKQILNDDVAFFESDTYFVERFKLINNFTDINFLPLRGENDFEYIYTSEDSGWILAKGIEYQSYNVYSFTDNVNNRSFEYSILSEDVNDEGVRHIEYVSNDLAYIMNYDGEMFQILNGEVLSFSDLYPELGNTPYLTNDYGPISFKILDDNTILIISSNQSLLKIGNGNVSVQYFESNITSYSDGNYCRPIFYGNEGAFYSNQKIYKSTDYGVTWNEFNVNVTLNEYSTIQYLGGSQYLMHVGSYPNDPSQRLKYISTDNGVSWKLIFKSYDAIRDVEVHDQSGFANSGPFGSYGLLKFRKFPNGF